MFIRKRILFLLFFVVSFCFISFSIFSPIFQANEIIIPYGIHPFDICSKNPELWKIIKSLYVFCCFFSSFVFGHFIYIRILMKFSFFQSKNSSKKSSPSLEIKKDSLHLLIGKNSKNQKIYLPESGLYQNFLITGTIGSGKTSSAMYPFTKQLIKYKYDDEDKKLGMLILDVKGNYYSQVKKYAEHYRRKDDLVVIELRR